MGFTSSQFTQTESLEWLGWDVVYSVLSFAAVFRISDLKLALCQMVVNSSSRVSLTFNAYFRPAVLFHTTVCFGGGFFSWLSKEMALLLQISSWVEEVIKAVVNPGYFFLMVPQQIRGLSSKLFPHFCHWTVGEVGPS